MRGVNDSTEQLLDLCFALQDDAMITPYYFYMCDMIPFSEHWRLSLAEAQHLQHAMMGYLPGFATPRIVCDVPFVGKRWVHQVESYDTERGMSFWRKNYRTSIEAADTDALSRDYVYTTRSTPSPRRVSSGGARRATTRRRTSSRWSGPLPAVRRPRATRRSSEWARPASRPGPAPAWPRSVRGCDAVDVRHE